MNHVIYRCKCGTYYVHDGLEGLGGGLRSVGEDVVFACRLAGAILVDASACEKCHPEQNIKLRFDQVRK